jgi:hypothetical protein
MLHLTETRFVGAIRWISPAAPGQHCSSFCSPRRVVPRPRRLPPSGNPSAPARMPMVNAACRPIAEAGARCVHRPWPRHGGLLLAARSGAGISSMPEARPPFHSFRRGSIRAAFRPCALTKTAGTPAAGGGIAARSAILPTPLSSGPAPRRRESCGKLAFRPFPMSRRSLFSDPMTNAGRARCSARCRDRL